MLKKAGFQNKPKNILFPDSISPDVFTGPNWHEMVELWTKRGNNLAQITCLPAKYKGVKEPSSNPTALGVLTTVLLGVEHVVKRELENTKIIIEAAGGVTFYFLKHLKEKLNGIKLNHITVFDPDPERIFFLQKKFPGITTKVADHEQFYTSMNGSKYDIWVNNGLGDNTIPAHIDKLIKSGVLFMTGGANNTLEEATKDESLKLIKDANILYMKDQFVSGGGWTLALLGLAERTIGVNNDASSSVTLDKISQTIINANTVLFNEAFEESKKMNLPLHVVVEKVMKERINKSRTFSSKKSNLDIAAQTIKELIA